MIGSCNLHMNKMLCRTALIKKTMPIRQAVGMTLPSFQIHCSYSNPVSGTFSLNIWTSFIPKYTLYYHSSHSSKGYEEFEPCTKFLKNLHHSHLFFYEKKSSLCVLSNVHGISGNIKNLKIFEHNYHCLW